MRDETARGTHLRPVRPILGGTPAEKGTTTMAFDLVKSTAGQMILALRCDNPRCLKATRITDDRGRIIVVPDEDPQPYFTACSEACAIWLAEWEELAEPIEWLPLVPGVSRMIDLFMDTPRAVPNAPAGGVGPAN